MEDNKKCKIVDKGLTNNEFRNLFLEYSVDGESFWHTTSCQEQRLRFSREPALSSELAIRRDPRMF